ncbi:LysR family transcriptional regulator [Streptomyces sp. N2-109]|uniref:LysR family transcriptional regulator n=1 Tax=Streptomyces gossypii TaxID=2883101 RepID=A0ABT2JMH5_9ACTN|nr:LysR family transcriptional regulator [Streptomyces gossypii]MCT2588918.1 LysR family transcriptional regulator [Streptomyces gossypii]
MIDPRLQTLRVLYERGTVTAAAEALHLTPSTVSQQLRQLADRLGVTLLEPHGRRVRLTPAALALLRHADAMFARWEEADAELAAYRDGTAGRLRVSAVATALAAIVAPAAERLRREHPAMTVDLTEDPGEDRMGLLLTDRADIAVVIPAPGGPPPDDPRFDQQPLYEEPQDLLVPAGHRLAARRRDGVRLTEAKTESWIRAGDPRDQHTLLLTACAAAGFTPRMSHGAVEWHAVAALVAHGFGISLVPRLAYVPREFDVVRVPLRGRPAPTRQLLACVRRGSAHHTPITRGLAALREAAEEVAGTGPADQGSSHLQR